MGQRADAPTLRGPRRRRPRHRRRATTRRGLHRRARLRHAPASETVRVKGMGREKIYAGVTKIYAYAGDGNDTIIVREGVLVDGRAPRRRPATTTLLSLRLGATRDARTATAATTTSRPARPRPGTRRDARRRRRRRLPRPQRHRRRDAQRRQRRRLLLGSPSGADTLDGGDGNDEIDGRGGLDTIDGGAGRRPDPARPADRRQLPDDRGRRRATTSSSLDRHGRRRQPRSCPTRPATTSRSQRVGGDQPARAPTTSRSSTSTSAPAPTRCTIKRLDGTLRRHDRRSTPARSSPRPARPSTITDDGRPTRRSSPIVTFADDGAADVDHDRGPRRRRRHVHALRASTPSTASMTRSASSTPASLDVYVSAHQARAEGDTLIVDGLGGNDLLDASAVGDSDLADARRSSPTSSRCSSIGGAGNDRLIGTPFDDVLDRGTGSDTVTGGAGLDTFFDASTARRRRRHAGRDAGRSTCRCSTTLHHRPHRRRRAARLLDRRHADRGVPDRRHAGHQRATASTTTATASRDEADEADPNFRTVGDGDRYDAGAIVENIKGIFEKAVLTGGDRNNTLVVNDSDNTVYVDGQSLHACTPLRRPRDARQPRQRVRHERRELRRHDPARQRRARRDRRQRRRLGRRPARSSSAPTRPTTLTLERAPAAAPSAIGIVQAPRRLEHARHASAASSASRSTRSAAPTACSPTTPARVTMIDLGGGDDEIVVGTVPLIPDTGNRTLEFPDGVPVADTQNMTNGNSRPAVRARRRPERPLRGQPQPRPSSTCTAATATTASC